MAMRDQYMADLLVERFGSPSRRIYRIIQEKRIFDEKAVCIVKHVTASIVYAL